MLCLAAFAFASLRSLAITNALIFGDEYDYSTLAAHFFDLSAEFGRNSLLWALPNTLYLFVYHLASTFAPAPYGAAKLLNSAFFALSLWPIYGTAQFFLSHRQAVLVSGLSLLLPYVSFASYFMPEAMYFFIFWWSVLLLLRLAEHPTTTSALLLGGAFAALFLTKPHGIVIVAVSNVVLGLVALWDVRHGKGISRGVFSIFAVDATFALAYLLVRRWFPVSGTAGLGDAYQHLAALTLTLNASPANLGKALYIVEGHITFLALLYGMPLIVIIFGFAARLRSAAVRRPELALVGIGLIGLPVLLGMATNLTLQASASLPTELGRIHARYYDFVFPLLLIGFVYFSQNALRGIPVRICFVAAAILVILGWLLSGPSRRLEIVDVPELAWLRLTWGEPGRTLFVVLGTCVLLLGALLGRLAKLPFLAFFVAAALIGNVQDFREQLRTSLSRQESSAVAQVLSGSLATRGQDNGLVVGSRQNIFSLYGFLFDFRGGPFVRVLPPKSVLDQASLPADVRWVVLLDNYDTRFPGLVPERIQNVQYFVTSSDSLAAR